MRVYTLHVHVNVGCCVMCIEFILEKMMDCQIPNRGWRLISLLHSLFILSTLYSITVLGMHNPETSLARCDCAPQKHMEEIRENKIITIELLKKYEEQQQQHTGGISGKVICM
eukprot:GHVQ01030109.1.p1 GENE.GHVQ01030109.1~~GHVQ01030109.1.p1  ORF type:complete len:113 (+),score=9.94 GHVQ01030109.1:287-625(+)